MDQAGLMDLIAGMNTTGETFTNSTETTSWKAHREAETLDDPSLFPLLRVIEDIPLLERFLKSRRPDLRIAAQYAIQYIREREAGLAQ